MSFDCKVATPTVMHSGHRYKASGPVIHLRRSPGFQIFGCKCKSKNIIFCIAYHSKCVDPWLTNGKKTCPVCKQPVEKSESKDGPPTSAHVDANETTPLLSENPPSTSHQATDIISSAELV